MNKKSIVLLFHGSLNYERTEKIYKNILNIFIEKFSGYTITFAYSSTAIINKIKRTQNITMVSLEERLLEIKNTREIKEVYIQPILLTHNKDYERCSYLIKNFEKDFEKIILSTPILSSPSEYNNLISILLNKYNQNEIAYLFVGHGGRHPSNSAFGLLGYLLYLKSNNFFTITFDEGISIDLVKDVITSRFKKLKIVPLLIAPGFHYEQDVSQKILEIFKNTKIDVSVITTTLGEWNDFIFVFVNKMNSILKVD